MDGGVATSFCTLYIYLSADNNWCHAHLSTIYYTRQAVIGRKYNYTWRRIDYIQLNSIKSAKNSIKFTKKKKLLKSDLQGIVLYIV